MDGTWIDIPGVPRRVPSSDALWSGGRSGGAGASGDWHGPGLMPRPAPVSMPQPVSTSAGAGWAFDVDLDDWIWIAMAVAAVFAGIIAVGYVIYAAPLLLAEVALDAALVSAAYRKLRRAEAGHWAGAVLRRTWVPAAILILSLVVAGYALQRVAPEARSIGGVVRALLR